MGTVQEPLAKGTEGAPHLGPVRPRVYSDLSPEEKDGHAVSLSSPPQEQPTDTSESSMTSKYCDGNMCFIVLKSCSVETRQNYSSIGDSQAQKEGQQIRKEEEYQRGCIQTGGKIAKIDAGEDITLVDIETQVDLGDELQERKDDDNDASKDVNATEPTVFDDEEVTMTMAQTLIKMKAKKLRLFDEQMAKRLHDEEVEQAAAREKQEKDVLERAQVLQPQYEDKQENID
nr:hypothetical protein [Tanacetum cinerariifolium]